jgi:glutamate carboxypeptidase
MDIEHGAGGRPGQRKLRNRQLRKPAALLEEGVLYQRISGSPKHRFLPMDQVLQYASKRLPAITDWIADLVKIESPTEDKAAVDRASEFVADSLAGLAKVKLHRQKRYGNHLRAEFHLPGRSKSGQIFGLGHLDTVWPLGTLARMPFRKAQGRLWGPGVFDMKSGVAFFIFAAEALRELDVPLAKRFVLQLNSEEEIGSPSSRPLTEAEARRSQAVLVAEPAAGIDGRLKTGRKGGGSYTVRVRGKASHAGLDFASGASAITELSRQLLRISEWTDLKKGVTVNPGVIAGGTRSNVVAAEAWAEIDVRAPRVLDATRLSKRFQSLKPFDRRTELIVSGSLRRPPMERGKATVKLFRLAQRLADEMGFALGEAQVGGGSDGNFTAALGVPTLDGLGAVGEGAHALHENVLIEHIPARVALLAKLIAALARE